MIRAGEIAGVMTTSIGRQKLETEVKDMAKNRERREMSRGKTVNKVWKQKEERMRE